MQIKNHMWDNNNFKLGSPDLQGMGKWGRYWFNKRMKRKALLREPPKTYKFDVEEYKRTGKLIRLD